MHLTEHLHRANRVEQRDILRRGDHDRAVERDDTWFHEQFPNAGTDPIAYFGAAFGLSCEALSAWLYVSPWWRPVAIKILGL